MATKVYHGVNLAILGLTPLAFVLSPTSMNFPVDIALGIALPLVRDPSIRPRRLISPAAIPS